MSFNFSPIQRGKNSSMRERFMASLFGSRSSVDSTDHIDLQQIIADQARELASFREQASSLRGDHSLEAADTLSVGDLNITNPFEEEDEVTPQDPTTLMIAQMGKSTRLMAISQKIISEKESTKKLESLETKDIIKFLAVWNKDSVEPAYKACSEEQRQGLAFLMGLPPSVTIESYFGKETGPQQKFITALRALAGERIDIDPKKIMESHRMSDSTSLNFSLLIKMIASTRLTIHENPSIFCEFSLEELKVAVVDNIQPLVFRDRVKEFYHRYIGASFSSEQLFNLILSEFEKHSTFLDEQKRYGITALANAAIVPQPPRPPISCFNCKGAHRINVCREKCRVHKKFDCVDKSKCYRDANKPAPKPASTPTDIVITSDKKKADKIAKAAQLNKKRKVTAAEPSPDDDEVISSPKLVAKSVSKQSNSDIRKKKKKKKDKKDILLDSGANVLCLSKSEYFDNLDLSNSSKSGSISVATGVPSAIKGSGSIGKRKAKFTPNFDHSLAPMSVITDSNIGIFIGEELVIIPAIDSIVDNIEN